MQMPQRLIPVLGLALALSAGASFLVYRFIAGKLEAGKPQTNTQLVVATRDLPVGTLLAAPDLQMSPWAGPVPPRAVRQIQDALGRGITAPVYRGEPVLDQRLAPKGAGAGLAPVIPPGKRAVAIRVNEIAGVSGFAVPGMRVDVLVQGRPPGGANRGDAYARTLLQNVEVLSAGQKYQRDFEGKPVLVQSVNLLVDPEEAELLSLANNEAKLQLVLRNPTDVGRTVTRGWFAPDLFPTSAAPVPRQPVTTVKRRKLPEPNAVVSPAGAAIPAEPPPVTIELWHGSKKTQEIFPLQGES
jgi:pilus assembly protein CpaB